MSSKFDSKRLKDYLPLLEQVRQRVIKEHRFDSQDILSKIYRRDDKVVTVMNHSTPLSWLPAVSLLATLISDKCGGDASLRLPVGVMDRFFFNVPLLKQLAEYLTQFETIPSFDEIIKKFESGYTDVAIFPEGSNCFFGEGEQIQNFRSPRFIELALKLQAKVCLAVHRGSEDWAHAMQFEDHNFPLKAYLPGWLNEKLNQNGVLMLPMLPKKVDCFRMTCELYEFDLKASDLSPYQDERMQQLWIESDKVRLRMQEMFDSLAS